VGHSDCGPEGRMLESSLPRTLRVVAHDAVVKRDGPQPPVELGAVATKREPRHFAAVPPACHKERSPAVSHGHSKTTVGPGASSLTWGREEAELHGMQGVKA
jgi:hypothetical protein